MTNLSPHTLVTEFHETYGLPILNTPQLPEDRVHLRYSLIAEEFAELTGALFGPVARALVEEDTDTILSHLNAQDRDLVETADALADLIYVIYGAALEFGIPLDSILQEVQRSNMSKLGEDGKPIYRADGKVTKGPNFTEPDLEGVLFP